MPTWFLIIVCVISWGVWSVMQKLATTHTSPMMMQVIGAYVYSAVAPLIFLYMKATNSTTTWSTKGIMWTTASCVVAIIASLSFATAVQKAHVHTVVGWTSTYPVLTFILCTIFLGEAVTFTKLIGMTLVVMGTIALAL